MNILLIHPDFRRNIEIRDYWEGFNPPSLVVNYLASILKQYNHRVVVLDSLFQFFRTGFKREVDLSDGLEDMIKEEKIEVVGMSVTSPSRLIALNLASVIKRVNPQIKIIWGGPHPTLVGERILEYEPLIDFLILGEGEDNLPDLVNALEERDFKRLEKIGGLAFRRNGEIIRTHDNLSIQDLDIYPFTVYDQYIKFAPQKSLTTVSITTVRGCPFYCNYCGSKVIYKSKSRMRSIENVIQEIKYLAEEHKIKRILFNDETFSFPLDRAKALLRALSGENIHLELECQTRFDVVDNEFLKCFKQAGGRSIFFGMESGSERIRELMGKISYINNKVVEISQLVKKHGIRLGIHTMFGYPTETPEDIRKTEEILEKVKPHEITAHITHVHPGTKVYKNSEYTIEDWLKRDRDFFPYETSARKLRELRRICNYFEQRFTSKRTERSGFLRDFGSAIEVVY
ncbi:cobalamin-dependent protein [candidate division KSB1 bacterium]|nr:cobalamin-dependent protein [candidate division KSB1 bacterium]